MSSRPKTQPKKICVVTGSRSEYGLLYGVLKALNEDSELQLQLVVTGAHLDKRFGLTVRQIEKDGFEINESFPILSEDDSAQGMTHSMGEAIRGSADAFSRLKPDLLVLLGDRYEVLAAAEAALMAKVPVAHIGGGDVTQGAYDEAIRHSITKMSHMHFVTNELSLRRLRQLGENPRMIFNVGSLTLDSIRSLKIIGREELEQELGFEFKAKNLLVTFHPATLDPGDPSTQFGELLQALDDLGPSTGIIFTKPNAEPEAGGISRLIDAYVRLHSNAKAYTSLGQHLYLNTVRQVDAVVGNSSSGLYEVPFLNKPSINIGDRQRGRMEPSGVFSCAPDKRAIQKALKEAMAKDQSMVWNPYGDGFTSARIVSKIKEIQDFRPLLKKKFFDENVNIAAERILIVAEAGVNHNGSLKTAKELIHAAKEAGADVVKFQTFKTSGVISKNAPKAEYQKSTTSVSESQWDMIQKLELDEGQHIELVEHAKEIGIEFLSAPFDLESIDLLSNKLRLGRLKIPSGEITHAPLLLKAARTGLPLILSTGMATLSEIAEALGVIAFGCLEDTKQPTHQGFIKAFTSLEGKDVLKRRVTLLHCTSEYPAPFKEANLRAMDTLKDAFGLPVGLSDHTLGISVAVAAAARGAVMIEKHFTLNRGLPGPDHRLSLEPAELERLVSSIREVEMALGDGRKQPSLSELKNKPIVRKSLVAARSICSGEIFSEENLTAKRPGSGISPFHFWDWLGKKAKKEFSPDEEIK